MGPAGLTPLTLFGSEPLLGENAEQELALLAGGKGWGDDDVGAWREPEPHGDLPQVDEVPRSGHGLVVAEEVCRKWSRGIVGILDVVDAVTWNGGYW